MKFNSHCEIEKRFIIFALRHFMYNVSELSPNVMQGIEVVEFLSISMISLLASLDEGSNFAIDNKFVTWQTPQCHIQLFLPFLFSSSWELTRKQNCKFLLSTIYSQLLEKLETGGFWCKWKICLIFSCRIVFSVLFCCSRRRRELPRQFSIQQKKNLWKFARLDVLHSSAKRESKSDFKAFQQQPNEFS